MIKIVRSSVSLVLLGILVAGLSACQKKEGPLEKAGKAIDQAAEKTGEKMEKVGEKVKDAAKEVTK